MNTKYFSVLLGIILCTVSTLGLVSCNNGLNLPDHELTNAVITLERGVCYGWCPIYTVSLYGDGRVEYEGYEFVGVTGVQTSTVSPEAVKNLVFEFYKADYFSMKDHYPADVTDQPAVTTSLFVKGQYKQVRNGCSGPLELRYLENRIDEVAGTSVWVDGYESPY